MLQVAVSGAKPIPAEVFNSARPMSKINTMIVDFPNGHIECGYVGLTDWTDTVVIEFSKPFKRAPVVMTIWSKYEAMTVNGEKAVIKFSVKYKGWMPYVAMGLDSDKQEWSVSELENAIQFYSLISGAAGIVGGGLLGRELSK